MIVFYLLVALAALAFLVDRATATTRARAVPVSVRMAEARRIAAGQPTHLPPLERGSVEFR